MAEKQEVFNVTIEATEDLSASGMQYKVCDIAGTIAAESDDAIGVIYNKPQSGENITVGVLGKLKGVAGAAISAGARLTTTTSGFLIAIDSGDGVTCGKNLNAAVASGDTFTFIGNFINADTLYDRQ